MFDVADTRAQGIVEAWVVAHLLPTQFRQSFTKRGIPLAWGGSFEFDAVSEDGKTIVCVSTSCCRTATGKSASGKYNKIRSDALYLLNAIGGQRRILAFTDRSMFDHFTGEQERGRFPAPAEIELVYVEIPAALAAALLEATQLASAEVSPAVLRNTP
jgi:hypothetical protein